jgi:hypothetical protein
VAVSVECAAAVAGEDRHGGEFGVVEDVLM